MPVITIDHQELEVAPGTTVLQAARRLGIEIPALCHRDGCSANTSCMCCVVKVAGAKSLLPSCATVVTDGMVVESETEEVYEARRTALELLLSDHVGDCIAPCMMYCPPNMDISQMLRHIARGEFDRALAVVKEDIALPAVLGRVCNAPCEAACRRREAGGAVSICLLKRFVADVDLASENPYLPEKSPADGKRVAVVGSGPAGLSAAYYIARAGHECVVYERETVLGGGLRGTFAPEVLPDAVLDGEIAVIERLGVRFECGQALGEQLDLDGLCDRFDAVLLAVGPVERGVIKGWGLKADSKGIQIDPATYQASRAQVFAVGGALRPLKFAVRSVAAGKVVAACIDQFVTGRPIQAPDLGFNTKVGKLSIEQLQDFLLRARAEDRSEPVQGLVDGYTADEARAEAERCMHCECSAVADCLLRKYSGLYSADAKRFKGEFGRPIRLQTGHPKIFFEPGKCIACGICVQIANAAGEALGLTFIGRGFQVRVDVPLGGSIAEGLMKAGEACAKACPTGALDLKSEK